MALFPMARGEIEKVLKGIRRKTVVPLGPGEVIREGEDIVFAEATADIFGVPQFVEDGAKVPVKIKRVEDYGYVWCGRRLFSIAWHPIAFRRDGWWARLISPAEYSRSREYSPPLID